MIDKITYTATYPSQPLAAKGSLSATLLFKGIVKDHLAAKGCHGFVLRLRIFQS